MRDKNSKSRKAEKAFLDKTLEVSRECLEMDRSFLGALEKKAAAGRDPLEPRMWENFIEARRSLVDFTTENLNLLAQDAEAQSRHKDVMARLETTLGEVMRLEEKLTHFLSENLDALRETIDGISKNQAIFSAYSRSRAKPRAETLETMA
jgi:predicted nuclease with TOPRIM domain